jgi:hypothetical protein
MDLDATAVDEQAIWSVAGSRQRTENTFPDAAFGPADEPIVERFLRTIDVSAVGPTSATAKRMNDSAQHSAVIHTRLAANIGRKQRLDPCPLRIGKPKEIRHLSASCRDTESQSHHRGNLAIGSGP